MHAAYDGFRKPSGCDWSSALAGFRMGLKTMGIKYLLFFLSAGVPGTELLRKIRAACIIYGSKYNEYAKLPDNHLES